MPDEPDKGEEEAKAATSSEDENDRPTVSPPFDPIAFAQEILKPSNAPAGLPPRPEDAATKPPPERASGAKTRRPAVPERRKTPTSTISLANARIPSNLPPRPGPLPEPPAPRPETLSSMNAVDREWADLEIATRPPPPGDSPDADPELEIGTPRSLDLDDIDDGRGDRDGDELEDKEALRATRKMSPFDDADLVDIGDQPPDEHTVDTVRRPIPHELIKPREREMTDRVSLGDYSGALEIAEKILADNPEDPTAKACAENCRTVLRQMYAARIGPLDRVPVVMVARDQLRWLSIDHKAGFVLSLVDGVSSLEMIIDVSGMPELETLRILSELAQQRIISLR
jgi:hypothetical protein